MNMKSLRSLFACTAGAAAAEMALVVPLLTTIMFGAFEAGNFFWNQHIVTNAVRDGARYAARRPLTDFAGCVPSTSVIDDTRRVTRTGIVSGGTPRIANWKDATTVSVTMPGGCKAAFSGGIYRNNSGGAPTVTVSATVPYNSLFGSLGFTTATLNLRADAQAAVMGF
jgi:Flp pilus assembly protein TadG